MAFESIYWIIGLIIFKCSFVVFENGNIPFPILLPRNFVQFIDHVAARKFEKTDLQTKDIFESSSDLVERMARKSSAHDLELNLEKEQAQQLYDLIFEKASQVDPTLKDHVKAENKKILNSLDKIEKKMLKTEKRHFERRKPSSFC